MFLNELEFGCFNDVSTSGEMYEMYCLERVIVNHNAFVYILPSEVTNGNK
jgi:hypothetical protein